LLSINLPLGGASTIGEWNGTTSRHPLKSLKTVITRLCTGTASLFKTFASRINPFQQFI
jgi:hypothetical protein